MVKQKKTIPTIDGLYHNYFLMVDLTMLKMYQCLYDNFSDFSYTLIVNAHFSEYF